MSKTFCPLPWIFQAVRNNGDVRLCAQSNASEGRGLLKKEDGSVYNAGRDNLESSRNSITLKQTRLDMLKGKNPSTCLRCEREDKAGVISRRQIEKELWKKVFSLDKARKLTKKDGAISPAEVPLIYYDLRLGNHCNLKCRMCGPADSDAWYSDHVKVWGGNSFKDSHGQVELLQKKNGVYYTKNQDYDWHSSPSFWRQIKANAGNIKQLHTVGGEPFLIEKHWELLQSIIDSGTADQAVIEYNTNLTVIPKKMRELWKRFKLIKIGVSIDGKGELNDYIRPPSRFENVEKNLDQLHQSCNNLLIWINTTVQVYNILRLTDLIQWRLKKYSLNINEDNVINFHALHNPNFLNVKILPQSYKRKVEERLSQFLSSLKENLQDYTQESSKKITFSLNKSLKSYICYMNSEDWSHLIPKFWRYTKKLDEFRSQ
ncbi:MAG: twitch domain-containing radical SAM protein, partial [Oligoflexia bacterium]|nr:twitch domain-containing radical SAM protein [Oligoflexia bacterium]